MTTHTPLTGKLLDYEYEIDVADEALREHLRAVLLDSLTHVEAPATFEITEVGGDHFALAAGGEVVDKSIASRAIVAKLLWILNRRSTERRPGSPGEHEVMIHAGAVEHDGTGVLMVGSSGSGKTTASIGAALHGFRFLTDDIVAVDRSGVVRGSRKPVGLRRGAMAALGVPEPDTSSKFSKGTSLPIAATSLGIGFGQTAPVGVVIFPEQHGPAGEFRSISRANALQRLTANCFDPVPLADPDFRALARLVQEAWTFEWTHGPLRDFADTLRGFLHRH